jgi:hypothetical protein
MLFKMRSILFSLFVTSTSFVSAVSAQNEDQKAEALKLYEAGNAQYNLGRWERAIENFEKAYETYPAPAFLFNIGQAFRQDGNCEQAVFFYRRYLSLKPDASNKAEAEGFIEDQTEVCKRKEASKTRTPTGTVGPDGKSGTTAGSQTTPTSGQSGLPTETTPAAPLASESEPATQSGRDKPGLAVIRFGVGGSKISLSEQLKQPTQATVELGIGYPISRKRLGVDIGPVLTYTPFGVGDPEKPVALTGLLVNLGVSYSLLDSLDLRGSVGLGLNILGGVTGEETILIPNNPNGATGALSSFNIRLGVGVEYYLTDVFAVTLNVAFSGAAAPEGLRDDIEGIGQTTTTLGVGYGF